MKQNPDRFATRAAEALLDGEAEALTRKAIDKALEGIRSRFGFVSIAFCRRARTGLSPSKCAPLKRSPMDAKS
jgi:hypothetical protein